MGLVSQPHSLLDDGNDVIFLCIAQKIEGCHAEKRTHLVAHVSNIAIIKAPIALVWLRVVDDNRLLVPEVIPHFRSFLSVLTG